MSFKNPNPTEIGLAIGVLFGICFIINAISWYSWWTGLDQQQETKTKGQQKEQGRVLYARPYQMAPDVPGQQNPPQIQQCSQPGQSLQPIKLYSHSPQQYMYMPSGGPIGSNPAPAPSSPPVRP